MCCTRFVGAYTKIGTMRRGLARCCRVNSDLIPNFLFFFFYGNYTEKIFYMNSGKSKSHGPENGSGYSGWAPLERKYIEIIICQSYYTNIIFLHPNSFIVARIKR